MRGVKFCEIFFLLLIRLKNFFSCLVGDLNGGFYCTIAFCHNKRILSPNHALFIGNEFNSTPITLGVNGVLKCLLLRYKNDDVNLIQFMK